MSKLKGIISPFTTPFKQDGSIDLSLVKPQVDWLIDNGVHGLAAGGSTGEGHVLNRDEYVSLMTETAESLNKRAPLVAGIIANSTSEVIARGQSVKSLNVEALQITPPSYLFRPDDDAMVRHFKEIYDECQIPIPDLAKYFHGNFSPGSFFLIGAISECPKIFFLSILYFLSKNLLSFFKD